MIAQPLQQFAPTATKIDDATGTAREQFANNRIESDAVQKTSHRLASDTRCVAHGGIIAQSSATSQLCTKKAACRPIQPCCLRSIPSAKLTKPTVSTTRVMTSSLL